MKVLLACFRSRVIVDYLVSRGHDVTSVDIQPASHGHRHITGSVFDLAHYDYDIMIGCPPCTWLTKAQMYRYNKFPETRESTHHAVWFVKELFSLPIPRIALENPPGHLREMWRPPSQIVRPSYFGDPYHKEICLWLKGLPPLMSVCFNTQVKSIDNHINGRMSAAVRSNIRSSWDKFPGMIAAIESQWMV